MIIIFLSSKYLHLTWGPYRLETSYCPPLRIPHYILSQLLPKGVKPPFEVEIEIADFGFVFDALLVVTSSGSVIRVSGLEMAWAVEGGSESKQKLVYDVSKGLVGMPSSKSQTN